MGVIDLNARVTALEKNSGNSQEIDQIEADLTALEETVGGLIEDISDKITLNPDLTFKDGDPEYTLIRVGNLCFLTMMGEITAGSSAVDASTIVGTLDADIRPVMDVGGVGLGENNAPKRWFVSTDGEVREYGGSWFRLQVFWTIATN